MRYVVDSNVALKWVLPETGGTKTIRVRAEFQRGIHELLAPDVFPIEVADSRARAERQGEIQPGEGAPKMADVFAHTPDLYPCLPLLPRAFVIASQARIGIYDCLYVVLAEREGCELLTADDRLVGALHQAFPFITLLASLP